MRWLNFNLKITGYFSIEYLYKFFYANLEVPGIFILRNKLIYVNFYQKI